MAAERGSSDVDRQIEATRSLLQVVKWVHEIVKASPDYLDQFEAWAHKDDLASKGLSGVQILNNARTALQMLTTEVSERSSAIEAAEDIAKGGRRRRKGERE